MAKIVLGLDARNMKNGMAVVRARINHRGTSAFINTGISVEPEYFDKDDFRTPISTRSRVARVGNPIISRIVRRYDDVVCELTESNTLGIVTATEIRTMMEGGLNEESNARIEASERRSAAKERLKVGEMNTRPVDFLDWLDRFGKTRSTESTQKMYGYVWKLLHEYCADHGMRGLRFADLEYRLFVELKCWIGQTNRGESVRHQVETCMHAAWREARRMRYVQGEDPWEDYSIERVYAPAEIEYAPIDEIRKLMRFDVRGMSGEGWFTETKDLLMLSWCLCGANLKDIYHMPQPKNGEFVFVRHKLQSRKGNKRPVHIRIEPEMEELLEKYRGKDGAFCFAEDVPNWGTFQRKVSDRLTRLCELSGTEVNFQRLRRSWATYALRATGNQLVVDNSMGHVPNTILTQHYGAHDWEDTAKCNRQMIDLLKE